MFYIRVTCKQKICAVGYSVGPCLGQLIVTDNSGAVFCSLVDTVCSGNTSKESLFHLCVLNFVIYKPL